jgi:kanamycin kinase
VTAADGPSAAGTPTGPVAVPASTQRVVGAAATRCVWSNELGGLTFELLTTPRRFLKWVPHASGIDLGQEAVRLAWLTGQVTVPEVLEHGRDDTGSWMATAALPGDNAVAPQWKARPEVAVRAIGAGLRAFHDGLAIYSCPFSWSAAERFANAQRRVQAGAVASDRWHPVHQHLTPAEALARLAEVPDANRLVVCHGDACAPNTLLDHDGRCSGHVDLGAAGVADAWADLAVATWSTQWNYGPGWEKVLLDAYGIDADPVRTAYYRLLWDLDP